MYKLNTHLWVPLTVRGVEGTFREKVKGDDLIKDEIGSIVSNYLSRQLGGHLKLSEGLEAEESFLNAITYNGLVQSDVACDDRHEGNRFEVVTRSRNFISRMEILVGILQEISSKLKDRIACAHQQVERIGSAFGLASLPPEILALIFSFTIYGTPRSNKPRALTSVRLSHVCSYFRRMVLADPQFWNEISSTPRKPELGLIDACLRRSKDASLDVHLRLYATDLHAGVSTPDDLRALFPNGFPMQRYHLLCDEAFSLVVPHTGRWRRLHLQFVDARGLTGLHDIFKPIQNDIFPNLESITEHHDTHRFDRTMAHASSWNTPILRSLNLHNCLPSSLPALPSIATLDIGLLSCHQVINFLGVLSKMEYLKYLSLDIRDLIYPSIPGERSAFLNALERSGVIVLDSVDVFTFRCGSDNATDDKPFEVEYLRTTLSKLSFPFAKKFKFEASATGGPKTAGNGSLNPFGLCKPKPLLSLHHLLSGFSDRLPKVTDCDIILDKGYPHSFYATFPTHLHSSIKHVTFMCNTELSFPETDTKESNTVLSNLKTLTLGMLNTRQNVVETKRWVNWLLGSAERHGGWDAFEELTLLQHVKNGVKDVYKYDTIITRNEILPWCTAPESGLQIYKRPNSGPSRKSPSSKVDINKLFSGLVTH